MSLNYGRIKIERVLNFWFDPFSQETEQIIAWARQSSLPTTLVDII